MTLDQANRPRRHLGGSVELVKPVTCPECKRKMYAMLRHGKGGYNILNIEYPEGGSPFQMQMIGKDDLAHVPPVEEAKPVEEVKEPEMINNTEVIDEKDIAGDTTADVDAAKALKVELLALEREPLVAKLKELGVEGIRSNMTRETLITKGFESLKL